MSHKSGRPARHAQSVAPSKGIFITTATVATVAVVGGACAFAFAATSTSPGNVTTAAFVSAHAGSTSARLSVAGLTSLLNARFAPARTAVAQDGSQAAVQATALLSAGSGQVSQDGNVLTLNIPAVADMGGSVATAFAPITAQIGALNGPNGQLAHSVNGNVTRISPLLNLGGAHANVSANVPIDLDAAVLPQLTGTSSAGAVTIHPHAGTITVDLSKALAGDETGTTGTPTLTPAVVAEIGTDINTAAATMGDNVVNSASNSVTSAPVAVHASVNLLSAPAASSSCTDGSTGAIATNAGLLGTSGGLLGGTLNGILGSSIGGTVSGLVCSLPGTLLPGLLTTLGLDANGTVGQMIEGTAPPAIGSVTVLGQPVPFDGSGINSGIANTLVNNLGGPQAADGSGSSGASGVGSNGSGGLGVDATVDGTANGDGTLGNVRTGGLGGVGLGGVNVGGLVGPDTLNQGLGMTPGFLHSLLVTAQSALPLGIAAAAGDGSTDGTATATVGSGSSSGSDLLDLNAKASRVLGSVRVGTGAGSTAPATGSSTGGTAQSNRSGILGLLHVGTSPVNGTTSGGESLINIGL